MFNATDDIVDTPLQVESKGHCVDFVVPALHREGRGQPASLFDCFRTSRRLRFHNRHRNPLGGPAAILGYQRSQWLGSFGGSRRAT